MSIHYFNKNSNTFCQDKINFNSLCEGNNFNALCQKTTLLYLASIYSTSTFTPSRELALTPHGPFFYWIFSFGHRTFFLYYYKKGGSIVVLCRNFLWH